MPWPCCWGRCHRELSRDRVVVDRLPMALPIVCGQPRSVTVKSGARATFTVKAKGKELGYRWYSRPSAEAEWTVIPGETGASLSPVGAGADNGRQFLCRAANADGTADSRIATLRLK